MTSTDEAALDPAAADALRPRVGEYLEGECAGRGRRIGIAAARFNGAVTLRLLEGALGALEECGVERADIALAWAPGAFELPLLARAFVTSARRVDAVVTLGAVIRGETGHYEVVAGECARGVQAVQLRSGVPVVFGVLTVNTLEQALARSRPDESNKGREAALTALEMVGVLGQGTLAR